MGTCSYIVTGASGSGCINIYYSNCHGARRLMTRGESNKIFNYEEIENIFRSKDIIFRKGSKIGIVEVSPDCYKDVNEVVKQSEVIVLTKTVAKQRPIIVIRV